jgi:hypothetical protein
MNSGPIINMWARGPNSLAQDRFTDEKQRSPKSHAHKGLIDIIDKERQPGREEADFW